YSKHRCTFFCASHLLVVNARQYSIVKDQCCKLMVGLGRIELPTSPLSGVRSSQLSYRPGGLSQSWWSWSGSNRRPPECKSGALPTELQPLVRKTNRGRLDAWESETSSIPIPTSETPSRESGRFQLLR